MAGLLLLAALVIVGAAASSNFRLDEESTPGAAGQAFSANYHQAGMVPESPTGPEAVSVNYRLNTDLVPSDFEPVDTDPPIITSPPVTLYVGHDRAIIQWETDELADSAVNYGLTVSYGLTQAGPAGFRTLHQVELTGLSANTLYNYRVLSTDPYTNGPTFSANDTFTTLVSPDATLPIVSTPVITFPAVTAARLEFTTNKPARTTLNHGTTAALGNVQADDVWRFDHDRVLTGLPSGSTYFFAIDAEDPMGNFAAGAGQMFDLPDEVAITSTSLPSGRRGSLYDRTLQATGGVGNLTWTLVSGALPQGINLVAGSGQLSGTATRTGTYNFTLRATDAGSPSSFDERAFSLRINSAKKDDDDDCSTGDGGGLPSLLILGLLALTALAWRRRTA